jgi:hypothetical protein
MVDVHLMKTTPPYDTFRMDLGLSPMCLSCPIAGRSPLMSSPRMTVGVTRP